MKKIIYIFSVMLFALFSCTNEELDIAQGNGTSENKVRLSFTVNDLPDFTVATKSGGESAVENMSLMTFDANGSFLGRVVANVEQTSENGGTGSALVPINTSTIHFIANYNWGSNEYLKPNGETESIMNGLTTGIDNFYVAWGKVTNVDFSKSIDVTLLRNYAKVTVDTKCAFGIAGFALAKYANKGTLVAQEGVLNEAAGFTLINQSGSDCTQAPKYMYEYENLYDNQTCVIVKKQVDAGQSDQFYKIQLLNDQGLPYKIERNYEYQVIIQSFAKEAKGSDSFEKALESVPANDIFAEVIKKAPTVSDADKNKLTVTPVYHLFTDDGTLSFSANYWKNGTSLANGDISISLIQNGHQDIPILPELNDASLVPNTSTGLVTTSVTLPTGDRTNLKLDSATLLVKAGPLTRIVTVMISKLYDFDAQSISYNGKSLGESVNLKFTIPGDFPSGMLPIKCYIKADGLNPVKDGDNAPLLVEQRDGTVYYIYEVNAGNFTEGRDKAVNLPFKTIQTGDIPDPTIENEYFRTGIFNMRKGGKSNFENASCSDAFYESGSKFTLRFDMDVAARVSISGTNISSKTIEGKVGINTVELTTTRTGATGNINLSADNYNNKTVSYKNNMKLQNDFVINNANLKYSYWWITENVDRNITLTVSPSSLVKNVSRPSDGKYNMTIKAGTDVEQELEFRCSISRNDYSKTSKVSNFLSSPNMTLQ